MPVGFEGVRWDRLMDCIAAAMLLSASLWELTAWARRDSGVWKPLLGWEGDGDGWDMAGLEGGRQPSTASCMAVSSAVAAASRCLRMDALCGMSVGKKWWSVEMPRVIVSVRATL